MNYNHIYKILTHYKFQDGTKELILRDCNYLKAHTIATGNEYGSLIDSTNSQFIGSILTNGKKNSVHLGPLFNKIVPINKYVCLHTHPNSTSFSKQDIHAFLINPHLFTLIVIGANGTVYILHKAKRISYFERLAFLNIFDTEQQKRASRYLALITNATTKEQAKNFMREFSHEVMFSMCYRSSLHYYRVKE
ncbi:hypothetical protein BC2926_01860 [Bacillus cereus]|nr:hypothetical protein BC2926_01860 [Bacillus cereus]